MLDLKRGEITMDPETDFCRRKGYDQLLLNGTSALDSCKTESGNQQYFSDEYGERTSTNVCDVPVARSGAKDFLFLYPPMKQLLLYQPPTKTDKTSRVEVKYQRTRYRSRRDMREASHQVYVGPPFFTTGSHLQNRVAQHKWMHIGNVDNNAGGLCLPTSN